MTLNNIGIVVPCYNEEDRLDTNEYKLFLSKNSGVFILFINDCSTDNTNTKLSDITAYSNAEHITLEKNYGKAEAVRKGVILLLNRGYDYIGFWDADLSTPLNEIKNFIPYFIKDQSISAVIGSRIPRLGSKIIYRKARRYIGRMITLILSLGPLRNISVYDSQCGSKIFNSKICDTIFRYPFRTKWLFDVEILMRINYLDLEDDIIIEYPLNEWTHKAGSKIYYRDIISIINEIIILFRY